VIAAGMTGEPREVEAALLVCGERPAETARALAALTEVAGYELQVLPSQNLHDVYFDTSDGRLGSEAIALRLRSVDGSWYITRKGPGRQVEPGTVDRSELELPWSIEVLPRVLGPELAPGPSVEKPESAAEARDPVRSMQRRGLVVVQDREAHRQRRAVIPAKRARGLVAELAIDAVTFKLSHGRVRLYEVEVELKAPGEAGAVHAVVEALEQRYPSELRRWPYGKLPTGRALEALEKTGALGGLLGADGGLIPRGCARIEEHLRSARPGH